MTNRKATTLISGTLVALFSAAIVSAQSSDSGAGNPTLLQAIQALQNSLNDLQTTVISLNRKVNSIVTNGLPPQPRLFYLTQGTADGAGAPNACQAGFHMASLWEIYDPSSVVYESSTGLQQDDSGSGPPAGTPGWIRTGTNSRTVPGLAGFDNCEAYTSANPAVLGTTVSLNILWGPLVAEVSEIPPWRADSHACSTTAHVWCVQDQ